MATIRTASRKSLPCNVIHASTLAPERPAASPMIPPGRPGSKSTIEVIHGSERRHGPVPSSPSRVQRTLRARVSSIPIIAVGTAGPAAAVAARTRIRWAVAHAIPHSAAAVAVAAHPLADVGDHLVGEHHQVEVVHDDPGAGQCPPDP